MTHPYWPTNAHLPGYVPMEADFMLILGGVGTAALAVFAAIWIIAGNAHRCWFPCPTGAVLPVARQALITLACRSHPPDQAKRG